MRLVPLQKLFALFRRKPVVVTEENRAILTQWRAEAKKVRTRRQLNRFIKHLTNDYCHDYGTIIYAANAAMIAALHVIDAGPQGGITGFQASCLGWLQVAELFGGEPESPKRLTHYADMLFPQYQDRFRPTISPSTWKWLQKEAARIRSERDLAPSVARHLDTIIAGQVPFGYTVASVD